MLQEFIHVCLFNFIILNHPSWNMVQEARRKSLSTWSRIGLEEKEEAASISPKHPAKPSG
jgi:hypothetical protein